ncbi:MAG: hypothetical protein ACLTR6_05270 [Clostridium fessum]
MAGTHMIWSMWRIFGRAEGTGFPAADIGIYCEDGASASRLEDTCLASGG